MKIDSKSVVNTLVVALFAIVVTLMVLQINPLGRISDIRGFYDLRFDDGNQTWPYSSTTTGSIGEDWRPVEYPVITGIYMWLITFLVPENINGFARLVVESGYTDNSAWSGIYYFRLTVISYFIWILISAKVLYKLRSRNLEFLLFFASPAVLLAMPLNWDIVCVAIALLAVHYFTQGKMILSSILLSLSVSAKFFPIIFLLSIFAIFFVRKQFREFFKYLLIFLVTWMVINLPIAFYDLSGWSYFYRLSMERAIAGDGSIFQIISFFGFSDNALDILYYILNLSFLATVFVISLKLAKFYDLNFLAFLPLVAFVTLGKVVSIQFVLWLTPFAIMSISKLANRDKTRSYLFFALWQVSEWIYHHAFYQMFVGRITQNEFGYSMTEFLVWSSFRHCVLIGLFLSIVRSAKKRHPRSKQARR